MPRENHTHITIVLDRSGSMGSVQGDTIGGFNSFLHDQKIAPGTATLSLVQFDDEYEILHNADDIHKVQPLTGATYKPRGATALLDAIGRAVDATGNRLKSLPEAERPEHVVVMILTDGQENSSKEYTRERVFAMIRHQEEKYGWEFVFLGANQDSLAESAKLGIKGSSTMDYAHNAVGTQSAFAATGSNIRAMRATGDKSNLAYKPEQREEAK